MSDDEIAQNYDNLYWSVMDKNYIPIITKDHLINALSLANLMISTSTIDYNPGYYTLYLEYVSFDVNLEKTSSKLISIATFKVENEKWNDESFQEVIDQFDHFKIHNTFQDLLVSLGSDTQTDYNTHFLSNRLIVKTASYVRSGGSNVGILTRLVELYDKTTEGVRKNTKDSFEALVKNEKNIKTIQYDGFFAYSRELSFGTVIAPHYKKDHDCFFAALRKKVAPAFSKKFPGSTARGVAKKVTIKVLRTFFDSKFRPSNRPKLAPVSLEDATRFAKFFNIHLSIIDENENLINGDYLPKIEDMPKESIPDILLYFNEHYFVLAAASSTKIKVISDALALPEKSENKLLNHDLNLILKVHFDLETVYNSRTVERSIMPYSGSIYITWGKSTVIVNNNHLDTLERAKHVNTELNKLFKLVNDGLHADIKPFLTTYISQDLNEEDIFGNYLALIQKAITGISPLMEPACNSNSIHHFKFKIIWIAYNGSRFDFVKNNNKVLRLYYYHQQILKNLYHCSELLII